MIEMNGIDVIVYLFYNAFRLYMTHRVFRILLNEDVEKRMYFLRAAAYILFFVINSASFLIWHWPPDVILVTNITGIFIISMTYDGTWRNRLIVVLLNEAIGAGCESAMFRVLQGMDIMHFVSIGMTVTNLLIFLIVLIMERFADQRRGEDVQITEWVGILVVPVVSILLSATVLSDCKSYMMAMAGELSLVLLNLLVVYLFDHLRKLYRKHSRILTLELQNQAYEKQIEVFRQSEEKISSLRHDMRNHIICMQQMLQAGESGALQDYLVKMTDEMQPQDRFSATGNALLDGLVNLKLGIARQMLKAKITCDLRVGKEIGIEQMELCMILGNLLDNALQALDKCEGDRELVFSMEENKGMLLIRIENSYTGKLQKRGEIFISTKEDKQRHGIGLKNVKRIVDKYNGEMKIRHTDRYFIVEMLLFLQKEEGRAV